MSVRRAAVPPADDGSAIVEFTFLAVLLMVPLVYVVLTVFQVQRAAYAVTQAAREAGRAFVTADDPVTGEARARLAARLALDDQGVDVGADALRVTCDPRGCLTPGAAIRVDLDTEVPLPFLPRALFGRAPASVGVDAQHVEVVDEFRAGSPADARAGRDG